MPTTLIFNGRSHATRPSRLKRPLLCPRLQWWRRYMAENLIHFIWRRTTYKWGHSILIIAKRHYFLNLEFMQTGKFLIWRQRRWWTHAIRRPSDRTSGRSWSGMALRPFHLAIWRLNLRMPVIMIGTRNDLGYISWNRRNSFFLQSGHTRRLCRHLSAI